MQIVISKQGLIEDIISTCEFFIDNDASISHIVRIRILRIHFFMQLHSWNYILKIFLIPVSTKRSSGFEGRVWR